MTRRRLLLYSAAVCCSSIALTCLTAAETPDALREPSPVPMNRFRAGYRLGFNLTARFTDAAGTGPGSAPGRYGAGDYDDGYVRPDSTAGDGLTWNWGYVHPGQISGDYLLLSRASGTGDRTSDGNPQHGFEFTYQRLIARRGSFRFGLEAAFNWMDLTLRDTQQTTSLTDAYELGGIIPPQAAPPAWAYRGTFFGPGALISDTPIPALTTQWRQLDGSLYGFRLGPYVELPLGRKLSGAVSAGLAVAAVDSNYRFSDQTSGSGFAPVVRSGTDSHADAVWGGYVAGNFSLALTRSWEIFAGAQFQSLEIYQHTIENRTVELDLRQSLFATFGIGYSF